MSDTSNTGAPVVAPAAAPAPAAAVDQIETVAKAAALGAAHAARLSVRGEIALHPFSTVLIAFASGVVVAALAAILIHFGV